jgi:hypothetical protein
LPPGRGAGRRIVKVGDEVNLEELDIVSSPRCASVSGVNVHANVSISAHDRMRLEDHQPDYTQAGTERVALNQDCARGSSMARRRRSGVAELRR